MEKCWLIRTKNKQILGPVTKQKIVDFVNKGSLAPEDEVTSGNGYWISIKEKSLIDKYVMGDIPQGFNPICEAPNILTSNISQPTENTGSLNPNTMPAPIQDLEDEGSEDLIIVPEGDDLDYPDMGSEDQIATVSDEDLEYPDMGLVESNPRLVVTPEARKSPPPVKASIYVESQEPGNDQEGKLPEGDDLDYPDMGELEASGAVDDTEFDPDATDPNFDMSSADITQDDIVFSEPSLVTDDIVNEAPRSSRKEVVKKKANLSVAKKKKVSKKKVSKPQRNDRYLFYVLILLIGLIIAGAYYYFTKIINSDVVEISNPFIQSVQAQTLLNSDVKKKAFLKYHH